MQSRRRAHWLARTSSDWRLLGACRRPTQQTHSCGGQFSQLRLGVAGAGEQVGAAGLGVAGTGRAELVSNGRLMR